MSSSTGFYWALVGFTGFYQVLLGFTGFYWVLSSFAGFYWVSSSSTGFYGALVGFTGFYLVLLSFTWFYWVLSSFTEFYRVLSSCIELKRLLMFGCDLCGDCSTYGHGALADSADCDWLAPNGCTGFRFRSISIELRVRFGHETV